MSLVWFVNLFLRLFGWWRSKWMSVMGFGIVWRGDGEILMGRW